VKHKDPINMTDAELRDEIQQYERRPFNGKSKWAMRLFNMREEVRWRLNHPHSPRPAVTST
jgi:hypothetical protein